MFRFRPVEIFLIEILAYTIIWLVSDYAGALLSIIISSVFFFILILSLVAEWIERSKVPRWYYQLMVISILAPLLVMLIFTFIKGGQLDWFSR